MPQPDSQILAKGYTSTVYHHHDSGKVIKVLDSTRAKSQAHFDVERMAYERLMGFGRPKSIVQFFGTDLTFPDGPGLVLERAEQGSLYEYLYHQESIPRFAKRNWARQAALALSFVHEHGILHCDIHTMNFFLDHNLDLKLGDFGAASIDGVNPLLLYRSSHQLWIRNAEDTDWRRDISVASEIFALGCVFYNIEMRNGLFEQEEREVNKSVIKQRLTARDMPDLGAVDILGPVIGKCWSLQYQSMGRILEDLPDDDDAV